MTTVRREVEIQADRTRVWDALTDFERMPEWFFGVARMEVFGGPVGVGTERRLTLVHRQSHRERIGTFEEGEFFTVLVLDPPFFTSEWTAGISLENRGEAVAVLWEMTWATRFGLAGRIFDRALLRPVVDFALRRSLQRFRILVEAAP